MYIDKSEDYFEWRNSKKEYHRIDGPARVWPNYSKEWWVNGHIHRIDGPAVENATGDKFWHRNGLRHRIDGPAIEDADGYKEWWIFSKKIDKIKGLLNMLRVKS